MCDWMMTGRKRSERVHFSCPPLVWMYLHQASSRKAWNSANEMLLSFRVDID